MSVSLFTIIKHYFQRFDSITFLHKPSSIFLRSTCHHLLPLPDVAPHVRHPLATTPLVIRLPLRLCLRPLATTQILPMVTPPPPCPSPSRILATASSAPLLPSMDRRRCRPPQIHPPLPACHGRRPSGRDHPASRLSAHAERG